jgi:hypothetical protein
MGYSNDDTTSASDHNERNSGSISLEYVHKEATQYRSCSSDDEEQNDSPGGIPPLVSECDRRVGSRPEIDRQKAAARISAQYPPLHFPHYASYALGPEGAGSPALLQRYSKQALHQIPQAIPAHAHAQQYPAHAHARQIPADTHTNQYPTHAFAHQYHARAQAQQYPTAPNVGPPSSHQYPAAPGKLVLVETQILPKKGRPSLAQAIRDTSAAPSRTPTIYGQRMPPEIVAAYEILARAKQYPLPNPHAAPAPPGRPQFAPPPGTQPANPYYHPPHLAQPSAYHMPASVPAPISYPHGYPTDLHYAGSGPIPAPGSKNMPGKSAPHWPVSAHSYADKADKTVSPSLLASQMEKEMQKDEASAENISDSSVGAVGEGEPKSKKRPRKVRKQQHPVYATLSKKTMIGIMEKYGPIVWFGTAKRPYLDYEKERTLLALRQIFSRWNPNFTDDFHYIKQTDCWMPIRGEQHEIARRVEIRRRCHVETKSLRTKMYEKRRNGPRSSWKTHTPRYIKVQDRCYRSNAGKESNPMLKKNPMRKEKARSKKDAQQSDNDGNEKV